MYNLIEAIKSGNLEYCKSYIKFKKPLNIKELYNTPPLIEAVKQEEWEIAGLLLENGADPDSLSSTKENSLMIAIKNGNMDFSRELIKHGIDINTVNPLKGNAGFYAIESNCISGLKLLIENGLDINALNNYNNSMLYKTIDSNKIEFVKYLLENKINISVSDLILAILQENEKVLSILFEYGADINTLDENGDSLLYIAVLELKWEMASFLLSKGALAKSNKKSLGFSIINNAKITGNIELVKQIILQLSK